MIIIICGYARSGKSTSMNYLASRGFLTLSSSGCLHGVTNDFMELCNISVNTQDKDSIIQIGETSIQVRNLLIGIAENVLVKNFGREIFARWIVKQIQGNENIAIEIFNQEEFDILKNILNRDIDHILQIRSPHERPEVDSRNIISGSDVIDNSGSLEDLYLQLDKY